MLPRRFDLASFYAEVAAPSREQAPLRQDLVRGLKEYIESVHGYDRYGGETVLLLPERLQIPAAYGYAARRVLHDRRISEATKVAVARRALDVTVYEAEEGVPHGLLTFAAFLGQHGALTATDLRFALITAPAAGEPLAGMDRRTILDLFREIIHRPDMPPSERLLWAHSLLARLDRPAARDAIDLVLAAENIPQALRMELARAWINARQPQLGIPAPPLEDTPRSVFVAEHLPFWIAHSPSWPTGIMVRQGLIWLARLGENPLDLAHRYIGVHHTYADQFHAGVAQILIEHRTNLPEDEVRAVIEAGIHTSGSLVTRRLFYQLGSDLYGSEYLERARDDSAGSVRQWAIKQLESRY